MTDKTTRPFDRFLDAAAEAVDAATDAAADVLIETLDTVTGAAKTHDPMARAVRGFVKDFATSQPGGITALFDRFVPQPQAPPSTPTSETPSSPDSTWSTATDDVRSPDASPAPGPADRAPRPPHATGVHVSPDVTGALKVVPLPSDCANVDCPNKQDQGTFVMVETETKVVSDGVRAIRLWMCAPCAAGLTGTTV